MAKPVEENYLITIKGTMEQNGENDTVELMTRGNFVQRGNSYYIVYAETEATGTPDVPPRCASARMPGWSA